MKNKLFSSIVVLALATQLLACGNSKVIQGVEYDTYGILNEPSKANPEIQYEPIWGNILWGCFLFGTGIAPIYFFGFSLFEPVGERSAIKGSVVK